MTTTFAAQVARGAEWLDANAPGWERKVDLGRLEMFDCARCVLGQAFAEVSAVDGYGVGLRRGVAKPTDMGFNLSTNRGTHIGPRRDEWDALRDTWVALIKERFSLGTLSDEVGT